MWSKISSALKPREGNDSDADHSDAQSNTCHSPPDPFRINATTYYTHQVPPTPPPGTHSRTASREEDLIWSLRTQLALQREMCAQFEIDLGARDQLVEALTSRLDASEKENDKRKNVVRSWKKKAAELEKMCRHLEEEVDHSRRESMERSIMDEASGEALRQLHRQISRLEREKKEVVVERDALAQTVEDVGAEVTRLQEQLEDVDEEVVRQLRHHISQLELEKSDTEAERGSLAHALEKADAEIAKLRGKLSATDEASVEAFRHLQSQILQLKQEKSDTEAERGSLAHALEKAHAEIAKLRGELSATDEASVEALRYSQSQILQLEQEKTDLQAERDAFAQARDKADAKVLSLREELDAVGKTSTEALRRLSDQVSLLEREKSETDMERDGLVQAREKAHAEIVRLKEEVGASDEANLNNTSEITRLRIHMQQLQKDSAAKEVTIVQLNKQVEQDKEDIDGLNIALESKQQELELVKRKHGVRGSTGLVSTRTTSAPSIPGKLVRNAVPSTASRTSAVGTRTLSPVLPKAPSILGRAANTQPPVSGGLRRASSSIADSKTKLSNRRLSVTSSPSEADEKENAPTPVPLKQQRRTMVPA